MSWVDRSLSCWAHQRAEFGLDIVGLDIVWYGMGLWDPARLLTAARRDMEKCPEQSQPGRPKKPGAHLLMPYNFISRSLVSSRTWVTFLPQDGMDRGMDG